MNLRHMVLTIVAAFTVTKIALAEDQWVASPEAFRFTVEQGNVEGIEFGKMPPIYAAGSLSGTPISLDLADIGTEPALLKSILAGPTDLLLKQGVDVSELEHAARGSKSVADHR